MSKRYRLLARAQIDGEVRDSGYIFTLADGVRGPMRAVGMNGPEQRDEKLYEEVDEEAMAAAGAASDPAAEPEDGDLALTDETKDEPKPDDAEVKTPVFVSEQNAGGAQAGGGGVQTPVHVSETDGDK